MSLAAVRESQGISVREMADRVGLTVTELRAIEEGKQAPRLCQSQRWAHALNISFEEFAYHFYEQADPAQLVYWDECPAPDGG